MRRSGLGMIFLVGLMVSAGIGASPAAPSYQLIEQTIGNIRGDWAKPGAPAQPNAAGWNALFDAMVLDLRSYAAAKTERDRLVSLSRLYQMSVALGSVPWRPAAELRESLREWLRPRVRLAWAERRLVERVHGLPPAPTASVKNNREKWVRFVENDLGQALQTYDAATTVAQRQNALKAVYEALNSLQSRNQSSPWAPSLDLQAALNDLYNLPNLDISIDVGTLSPVFNANLVTNGPVYRKGYVSQVTAGPKTGFGLLPSDDGILFYNKQLMTSVTPIWDFQQQVERDPKGRRAAKMYHFDATSTDSSELTIFTAIRPTGLQLWPAYKHNVGANIQTTPQEGGGVGRAIAALIGMNQSKITRMTREKSLPQFASNIEKEAMEEGLERTSREAAKRNTQLAQYLIGGDRAAFRNILVEGLSLRSRPQNALIGGKIEYLNAKDQVGADAPQPPSLLRPDSGVSADVHLSSVMTNFTRGYLQRESVQKVENLLVVTKNVPPGSPPSEGVKVSENVDYPAYLRAVASAQALNDPKVLAIRVKRPTAPPEFGVDSEGHLVALVNDFQLEVPAPPQAAKGGMAGPPARVYRIVSPQAEFVISFKVVPKTEKEPLRLSGKVEDMDPGPRARVFAVNVDEAQAVPLTAFTSTFILGLIRSKVRGQPIDVPLSDLQLRGFAVRSVSPLDPSGWIRVTLVRTTESPGAGIQPPPGAVPITPAPSPAAGPRTSAAPSPSGAVPR